MTHRTIHSPQLRKASIVLVLVLLLSFGIAAAPVLAQPADGVQPGGALQGSGPRFESGACDFGMQTSYEEGKDLECGWLIVPEKYDNPTGPEIRLAVAIIKSHAENVQPDPIVMLQGGPGGSTIYTYLQMLPLSKGLTDLDRDVILFDQRGTMYTEPSLFCQEVYDVGIDLLDDDISREGVSRQYTQALDACHDRLVSEGVNLSAYNSLENAHDVETLRQVLGYDQINLYGVSYGTLLALHVMRDYPQGLRSVTLDSVVPTQTNFLTTAPQTVNDSIEKVFSTCAQDPDCNKAYPDLKKVFYEQVDRLNANKEKITLFDFENSQSYPALLDGDTLISMITQMLYQTDMVPMIPRVIYDIRAERYSFTESLLSFIAFDKSMNYGMYYSVLCSEDSDFTPQDVNLSGLPEQMLVMQENDAAEFLQSCADWQVETLPAVVDDPVTSDLRVLVLSGGFDPVTPPKFGEAAKETLPNSYSFVFPAGGHGQITSGACQASIYTQFLADPGQRPDGSCIDEQKLSYLTPGAIIPVPMLIDLLSLRTSIMVPLGVYGLALLFLLSALLIYPVVWLVRVVRGSSPATAPVNLGSYGSAAQYPGEASYAPQPAAQPAKRPLLYRLSPWFAAFAGIALLVFIIVLFAVGMQLALENDSRVYIGLPGSARALFLLPLLALISTLVMASAALIAWVRRAGSVWGRLYLTLLTFAAVVCLIVLLLWRILFGFFAG